MGIFRTRPLNLAAFGEGSCTDENRYHPCGFRETGQKNLRRTKLGMQGGVPQTCPRCTAWPQGMIEGTDFPKLNNAQNTERADWDAILKIRSALSIPVIANGNVHCPHLSMLRRVSHLRQLRLPPLTFKATFVNPNDLDVFSHDQAPASTLNIEGPQQQIFTRFCTHRSRIWR